jgi:hypothetical protein
VQIANQWNKLHTDARGGMLPGVEARDLTSLGNIGTLSSVTKGNQLLTKSITSTLSPQLQTVLETCVDSIRVEDTGSLVYVWVDWFISLPEAESLTCNPYPAIRLSQLYMLLRQWILSGWGSVSKMPESSLSLSEIKRSVGRSKDGRTVNVRAHDKAFNLLVTDKSEILYIPPEKETDNVEQYEQLIEAYGLTTDGAYTFAHSPPPTGEGEDNDVTEVAGRTLPRNMPVYVDWVNGKFMYTQGNGLPTVLDLTKSVKLRPFHVTRLLSRTVDQMESYLQYTARCIKLAGGDVDLKPTTVELLASGLSMNDLSDYGYDSHVDGNIMDVLWRLIRIAHRTDPNLRAAYKDVKDIPLSEFAVDSGVQLFRCVGRMFSAAYEDLSKPAIMTSVNRELSVYTTCQVMGFVTVMAKFTPAVAHREVKEADDKERAVYVTQNEDPNRQEPEPLHNIRSDFAMLPHQFRAENALRPHPISGSPKLAVLDVKAGGGKTLMALCNIIAEMKRCGVKRALIMCPSHLVKDYVGESVFLTEGKFNVIPITGETFINNGEARLTKMIRTAPQNTIFVTDYNFVGNHNYIDTFSYGGKMITIFRNAEYLRQFRFEMLFLDESHLLGNEGSLRTQAVLRLASEIPMKRIMSGTLANDTLADLPSQMALLDPSVLGTMDDFKDAYAQETNSSGKVIKWKPGAQRAMKEMMRQHAVFFTALRKEWAALLPPMEEQIHTVELTQAQRTLYNQLFEEEMARVQRLLANDKEYQRLQQKADDPDASLEEREAAAERLEQKLTKVYLSRIEQFLSAPAQDPQYGDLLKGTDRVSPKVAAVVDLVNAHINKKQVGKVLVFCTHLKVAKEVYDNLPPAIKSKFIYYTASRKLQCAAKFENDPNIIGMIGGEKTMNTGLNFQFVSRLIRVETVWTPGSLEQGNSRMNRPKLKGIDPRTILNLDWVIVNNSIDVTKMSRLIAKKISIIKFEESNNPAYEALPEPPMVSMTLENIMAMSDFGSTMAEHLQVYQTCVMMQNADAVEWRKKYEQETGRRPQPIPVRNAGLMTDKTPVTQDPTKKLGQSKLMARTPYVEGMSIYDTSQLEMVRYDLFVGIDDGDSEDTTAREQQVEEENMLRGYRIHTEIGDGVLVKAMSRGIRVRLDDDSTVVVPRMSAFVMGQRKWTNSKDMRDALLKMAGNIPIDAPVDIPANIQELPDAVRLAAERKLAAERNAKSGVIQLALNAMVINDFLALTFDEMEDTIAVSALARFGFKLAPQMYTAYIKNPKVLQTLMGTWIQRGFTWPGVPERLKDKTLPALDFDGILRNVFRTLQKADKGSLRGVAAKSSVHNWFQQEFKPNNDNTFIKPFPILFEEYEETPDLFIALPITGQAGTLRAIKNPPPGITWKKNVFSEMFRVVTSQQEALDVIAAIEAQGIVVEFKADLINVIRSFRVAPRKHVSFEKASVQPVGDYDAGSHPRWFTKASERYWTQEREYA